MGKTPFRFYQQRQFENSAPHSVNTVSTLTVYLIVPPANLLRPGFRCRWARPLALCGLLLDNLDRTVHGQTNIQLTFHAASQYAVFVMASHTYTLSRSN